MLAIQAQQKPANANRPKMFGSLERFKHTVLVSQAGVDFHSARTPRSLGTSFSGSSRLPTWIEGAPERRCECSRPQQSLDLDPLCGPAQPYAGAQAASYY